METYSVSGPIATLTGEIFIGRKMFGVEVVETSETLKKKKQKRRRETWRNGE